MHENSPKGCRGETVNGRESRCRNRKRLRNNIDTVLHYMQYSTVDAGTDQQDGNQESSNAAVGRVSLL